MQRLLEEVGSLRRDVGASNSSSAGPQSDSGAAGMPPGHRVAFLGSFRHRVERRDSRSPKPRVANRSACCLHGSGPASTPGQTGSRARTRAACQWPRNRSTRLTRSRSWRNAATEGHSPRTSSRRRRTASSAAGRTGTPRRAHAITGPDGFPTREARSTLSGRLGPSGFLLACRGTPVQIGTQCLHGPRQ